METLALLARYLPVFLLVDMRQTRVIPAPEAAGHEARQGARGSPVPCMAAPATIPYYPEPRSIYGTAGFGSLVREEVQDMAGASIAATPAQFKPRA